MKDIRGYDDDVIDMIWYEMNRICNYIQFLTNKWDMTWPTTSNYRQAWKRITCLFVTENFLTWQNVTKLLAWVFCCFTKHYYRLGISIHFPRPTTSRTLTFLHVENKRLRFHSFLYYFRFVVSVTQAVIIIRKFSKQNPQFTTMCWAMLHMVWLIVCRWWRHIISATATDLWSFSQWKTSRNNGYRV